MASTIRVANLAARILATRIDHVATLDPCSYTCTMSSPHVIWGSHSSSVLSLAVCSLDTIMEVERLKALKMYEEREVCCPENPCVCGAASQMCVMSSVDST